MDTTLPASTNEFPGKSRANRYLITILLVTPILVLPLVFAILMLLPQKDSTYTKYYTNNEKTNYIEISGGWTLDYSSVSKNVMPRTVGNDLRVSHEIKLTNKKNDTILISQSVASNITATPSESCYSPSKDDVIIKEPIDATTAGAVRRKLNDTYQYTQLHLGCSDQNGMKYHITGGGDGIVTPYFVYTGSTPADADEFFIRNFARINPVQLFSTSR
jgi:hypothetical protein